MPEHNQLSFATALSRAAALASGIGEEQPGMTRLGETLQPVLDLWSRPEWALIRGENGFARNVTSVAVAARFSTIELTLATTVRVMAVVRLLSAATTAIQAQIDSGVAVAANPVTSRGLPLDDRFPVAGQVSQLLITTGDTAAGANLPQVEYPSLAFPQPDEQWAWVLVPGSRLFLASTAVNTTIAANLIWYERQLLPGEERG